MNKQKNETAEEQFKRINRDLKEISWRVDKMLAKNKELKARNEELEKENEKLHGIILKMSQEKC
ncbi:hypothetical protein SAMN05216439_0465 [Methanobrevibacter gottschalkii]|uniref:Cell division protein ZapB n=1 Tax=Methanobrevibacter gottschalkii TaxID=190974 RepID=A0A1H7PTI8_9EURY|nr:hypothetical protein [Methanobrevibacter gottschalkii]SEL39140.1 hypothetical protein SAMN05216439_0465 [Methanobrevibacter gottschalkii]